MTLGVNVKETAALRDAVHNLQQMASMMEEACQKELAKADKLKKETQNEERNSHKMLESAKSAEKAAKVTRDSLRVTSFFTPGLIAALKAAEAAFKVAVEHRKLMERRYKVAKVCVRLAQAMYTKLSAACMAQKTKYEATNIKGIARINMAGGDLGVYHGEIAPELTKVSIHPQEHHDKITADNLKNKEDEKKQVLDMQNVFGAELLAYEKWRSYQTNSQVAYPPEIIERINPGDDVQVGLLAHLYVTDARVRLQVDELLRMMEKPDKREKARIKSRKNMAGRLGEAMIRDGLSPFANEVNVQVHCNLTDGRYTKIDMAMENLRLPMVFGRGEGMGAREGGNVAIEVKTGQTAYLKAQKEHIATQVSAHKAYDVSLVICTRDIHDMNCNQEKNLRDDVRDADSRLLGMLPHKARIDGVVWNFLERSEQSVN